MKKRTYLGKPLGDIEYLLEQWGWWRMSGMGVPRYVSPLYALIRDNMGGDGGVAEFVITDDVALVVDSAVAKLTKRDPQMGVIRLDVLRNEVAGAAHREGNQDGRGESQGDHQSRCCVD